MTSKSDTFACPTCQHLYDRGKEMHEILRYLNDWLPRVVRELPPEEEQRFLELWDRVDRAVSCKFMSEHKQG